MADATSLYPSPEPRVYVKKISWYLNLEIIVIRKLCPNGKCLAVTLLFGNHGLTLFWGAKRYQTCLTNKIFCWSKFVVVQILSNAIERGETRCPSGKRLETKQPSCRFIAKHFPFKQGFMLWSFGFVKPGW